MLGSALPKPLYYPNFCFCLLHAQCFFVYCQTYWSIMHKCWCIKMMWYKSSKPGTASQSLHNKKLNNIALLVLYFLIKASGRCSQTQYIVKFCNIFSKRIQVWLYILTSCFQFFQNDNLGQQFINFHLQELVSSVQMGAIWKWQFFGSTKCYKQSLAWWSYILATHPVHHMVIQKPSNRSSSICLLIPQLP